jgi:hypothetical protein
MIHPITFSIPKEKIVNEKPIKRKMVSDLIPGVLSTYIYQNEKDYYQEYQQSLFAITTKKGGWDCMRHYEIIANRCLPYFPNIEECPITIMTFLPKDLVLQSNELYNKFHKKQITDVTEEEWHMYDELVSKFIDHMTTHLTTQQMARYIIEKSHHPEAKRILYLSGCLSPDYLRCVTLHGMKEVFGAACHDYPKVGHIYQSEINNYPDLYGKGITYTNLLDQSLHDDVLDKTVIQDIINKNYDLIIYGSYHRGMPFFDIVQNSYSPNQVILLCGQDIHPCDYDKWTQQGYHVFVRELYL